MKKPFKETKVGQFLQSKGFTSAINIVGGFVPMVSELNAVKDAVLGTSDAPPEVLLSPAEKAEFLELYKEQVAELDIVLKDAQSARNREVQLNLSDQASWLSKNITSILALLLVTAFISLNFTYVLNKVHDPLVASALHDMKDLMLLLCGYYWGSSSSSKMKDGIISQMGSK